MPQIIFLNCLFGYLSLLIILKWCTGSQADLYHVMIYMFLSPTDALGENELFWGQRPLQVLFSFQQLLCKNIFSFKILNRAYLVHAFADHIVIISNDCSAMDAIS